MSVTKKPITNQSFSRPMAIRKPMEKTNKIIVIIDLVN